MVEVPSAVVREEDVALSRPLQFYGDQLLRREVYAVYASQGRSAGIKTVVAQKETAMLGGRRDEEFGICRA